MNNTILKNSTILISQKTNKFWLLLLTVGFLLFANSPIIALNDTIINTGDMWKYLDDGSDQADTWYLETFDDALWLEGPSEFGYGDGDEATVVSYGPDVLNKHITTYFRKDFIITDTTFIYEFKIDLKRDDGAVVYVNGVEAFRSNLPSTPIFFNTFASSSLPNSSEDNLVEEPINKSLFRNGSNLIAVEIHQATSSNVDLSFDLQLIASSDPNIQVTRKPYLQINTPTSVIVKWRTNIYTESKLLYGTSLSNLTDSVFLTTPAQNHELLIDNLSPNTTYYYALANADSTILATDFDMYFRTSPTVGSTPPVRIWALGDCGQPGLVASNVRNSYYTYAAGTHTDLMLLLGDNAYNSGTDEQYQAAIFNMHTNFLKHTPVWPCPGNHDYYTADGATQTGPYYDIFTLPKNAEAGGLASGNEAYYSFDYANIHFISMDSQDTDISEGSVMFSWLENDLAATTQEWIIAFWHHPPYSKGSHNSDTETNLILMRQNAVPILEAAGVDLVLSGHSHNYERSYLLHGHYGFSSTFNSTYVLDTTSGNTATGCAYQKTTNTSSPLVGKGAVYTVSGSASKLSPTGLGHPAMKVGLNNYGSVIIDVAGNQLDLRFMDDLGGINDAFTIIKDDLPDLLHLTTAQNEICEGESSLLTATAGWNNYQWYQNGIAIGAPSATFTATTPGIYQVAALDGNNCQRVVAVEIFPKPDIDIITTNASCGVNNGQAVVSVTGNLAQHSFSWDTGSINDTLTLVPEGIYQVTVTDADDCSTTASADININPNNKIFVQLKVLLQGAYDNTTGLMANNLRTDSLITLSQPYNIWPWVLIYNTNISDINSIPANTTDWVIVEARDTSAAHTTLERLPAFLMNDGSLMSYNGVNLVAGVYFNNLDCHHPYHFVVRQRNHIDIMTADSTYLPISTPIDLTNPANVQDGINQLADLGDGNYGMHAGDTNGDGVITVADFNVYFSEVSIINQYIQSDLNFDAHVTVTDFNIYVNNISLIGISDVRY